MPSRFEYERAIRRSGLPPLSRLLALTLATWADTESGVIPDEHQPAQSVLMAATGMSKSAFLGHRKTLAGEGWISYTSPTRQQAQQEHAQCSYRINVPAGSGDDLAQSDETGTFGTGSQDGLGRETTVPRSADDLADPDESGHEGARSGADLGREPTTRVTGRSKKPSLPPRLDVEQICRHLADRIEQNGSKRPTITPKWRTDARLLIDKDGRTVEQIVRAIDWCQTDPFWRSNVMSMPTLRQQYDRLRLKATEARDRERERDRKRAAANPTEKLADRGVF